MRVWGKHMKYLIGGVMAALLTAGPAAAKDAMVGADAVLACSKTADAPLCLLKLFGERDGGVRHIHSYVFFGRRDLLAQAGITDERAEAWMAVPEGFRGLTKDSFAINRAVRDAVELDSAGAASEQALAPIEELSTGAGPDARLHAYGMLSNLRGVKGQGFKPSRGLVALGLSRWEAAMQDRPLRHSMDDTALRLAGAYARIGDAAGAERAVSLDKRKQGHWSAVEHLTAQRRWDDATEAARPTEPKYELVYEIGSYRRILIQEAIKAGRTDVALKVAEHVLQAEAGFARSTSGAEFALPIVHKYAPDRTAYWAERMEKSEDIPLALAAHWGWMAAGRPDRARQITERWLARLREVKEQEIRRYGLILEVQKMLLAEGRMDELQALRAAPPRELLELDLKAGRGVARLDEYLALAATDGERELVLESCASTARSLDLLEASRTCVLWLTPLDPLQAGSRALAIAEYASWQGRPELMREMVQLAMHAYEGLPPDVLARTSLRPFEQSALEAYITAEIADRPRT